MNCTLLLNVLFDSNTLLQCWFLLGILEGKRLSSWHYYCGPSCTYVDWSSCIPCPCVETIRYIDWILLERRDSIMISVTVWTWWVYRFNTKCLARWVVGSSRRKCLTMSFENMPVGEISTFTNYVCWNTLSVFTTMARKNDRSSIILNATENNPISDQIIHIKMYELCLKL